MSKALIINGADFSANKLTTIEFADIPCTGISFSEDSLVITGYEPTEIEYIVSPSNTTDAVMWASSDIGVATVANGYVTATGLGNCTITATCGSHSASASITVSIVAAPSWAFSYLNKTQNNSMTYNATYYNRLVPFGAGAEATENEIVPSTSTYVSSPHGIKLPANTVSVTIDATDTMLLHTSESQFWWTSDVDTGEYAGQTAITAVSEEGYVARNLPMTFVKPEGADSFIMQFRTASTYTAEDNPSTIANNAGITITFNSGS